MKILTVTLMLTLGAIKAFAIFAPADTVKGVVYDSASAKPVKDVTVAAGATNSTATNASGSFELIIPSGTTSLQSKKTLDGAPAFDRSGFAEKVFEVRSFFRDSRGRKVDEISPRANAAQGNGSVMAPGLAKQAAAQAVNTLTFSHPDYQTAKTTVNGTVKNFSVKLWRTAGSHYDSIVLANQPVGYWPLTTVSAADRTGHGMDGKYTGSPAATDMPNGDAAVAFNGVNQYCTVADNDYLEITRTGILTIEAWMRPDVLQFPHTEDTGYLHWMGKGTVYGSSGNQSWVARIYNLTNSESRPNRISGYAFNPAGGLGTGSYFEDKVTAGKWIHFALVINTKNTSSAYPTGYTKIFKSGVLRDQDLLKDYNIVPGNGNAPVRFGTENMDSFLQGAIGKVAIYDYELTSAQLASHYEAMGSPIP